MKINILGTEYDYEETTSKLDIRLCSLNGYTDNYAKIIRIEKDFNENDPSSIQNFDEYKNKVRRHEIIHAVLFESGLCKESDNEMIVDWLAIQFPKLLELFKAVNCI